MSPLFDAYIMVDWSAASKPVSGTNSIWIGALVRTPEGALRFDGDNPRTRAAAQTHIFDLASDLINRDKKVLIGFDFAMGYPTGTSDALGLDPKTAPAWKRLHDHFTKQIVDRADNSNDRFAQAARMNAVLTGGAHPFWGTPVSKSCATLATRKGDFRTPRSLPEHRRAEAWIKTQFKAHPKSVWQLLGAGAVGSQSLLGIPTVTYLRDRLPKTLIWPFETGSGEMSAKTLSSTACILAEIYPSTVKIAPKTGEILDQAQVRTLSKHFESLDSAGELGSAFEIPDSISDREKHKILDEEGWILAK